MDFKELQSQAVSVRNKYHQLEQSKYGKAWSTENIMEGFVGDVGDLMKLVMAKSGIRDIESLDEKLAHELADCLWSIIVLANKYNINLEDSFLKTMNELNNRIDQELSKQNS